MLYALIGAETGAALTFVAMRRGTPPG